MNGRAGNFKEEETMGQIGSNSGLGSYAADYQYRTEQAKKNESAKETGKTDKKKKVSGRTIGEPELSEKAARYYEKLKEKYSNMDFILVSPDKKEEAESKKGLYQSAKELIVLIDTDKIEKMAEDEAYREKYESILSNAAAQTGQIKESLGVNADSVTSVGMTFDDHGNASFFVVIDKSLAAQRNRIAQKKEERAEEKKVAEKKAAEKAKDKRAEAGSKDKYDEKVQETDSKDKVTVTASSMEELLKKIDAVVFESRADYVKTEAEKAVGGSFDYSI